MTPSLPLPNIEPIDTTELEANLAWLESFSAQIESGAK